MIEDKKIIINGEELRIIKHIGKGKGGNSYLAELSGKKVVYKQMHYEENSTYTFEANKLQSELRDYQIMKSIGLKL